MNIVVILHANDRLAYRRGDQLQHIYMIGPILDELRRQGHKVAICNGLPEQPMPADLAIMHVDLTVVPPEYVEFGASYPRCLNLVPIDISKRVVSGALIEPGSEWKGPIMVKSNLNWPGQAETQARAKESAPPGQANKVIYAIYNSLERVPREDAANSNLVLEKFLPERDGDNYVCRFWSFAGNQERCTRVFSHEPVVKASNQIGFEFCDVPEELRDRRRDLGFDFGKFDFVINDGRAVLLDANKTPGLPPVTRTTTWPTDFANGLLACLD